MKSVSGKIENKHYSINNDRIGFWHLWFCVQAFHADYMTAKGTAKCFYVTEEEIGKQGIRC